MAKYHMYYGMSVEDNTYGFIILTEDKETAWGFGYKPNLKPEELKNTPAAIEGMKSYFVGLDWLTRALAAVGVDPEKGIEDIPAFTDCIQLPDFELDE